MRKEEIVLNPFLRSYQVDKVMALVVAFPIAKQWYPLARKSGFRGSLEDFQDLVVDRLFQLQEIDLTKLEFYIKKLATTARTVVTEVLVEDFETLSSVSYQGDSVEVTKGVESFWSNWLDSLKAQSLKPFETEKEVLQLIKAVPILRFLVEKGFEEVSHLEKGENLPFRYRTWWSQMMVLLAGSVNLPQKEVQKRVSTWLAYYVQHEKTLLSLSALFLGVENNLVDLHRCYEKKPVVSKLVNNELVITSSRPYCIYKVNIQSYVDRLFDAYFSQKETTWFKVCLGSQDIYHIPFKGFVLGGDLESLVLEALASYLVKRYSCRFIGVIGSFMYLEFKEDRGDFPIYSSYFKELLYFEAVSCGKKVQVN